MATILTPSHPQFVFVFAAVRRADRKPRICMLRTVAGDEHAARRSLVRDYVLSFAGRLPVVEDCATVRRDPAQQLKLTSVIYLMTAQLDGVVERCNQRWLTGEGNV